MLSARSPVSVRPLYGVEEFRKSRSMAGGMTGGLVLLALSICMVTPVMKTVSPPKSPPAVMLMRVVRPEPTPQPVPASPDAMRKLLSQESEVKVPVPPPVVEKPKAEPPRELKPVAPEPVKTKPVRKTPPVKKKPPVAHQPQKPASPAVETSAKTDAPPAAVASTTASAAPAPAVAGTQERPDDKSKALATVLEVLNRHKRYPKQARRIGAEGTVQLLVTISADGKVNACSLGKGSGSSVLDAATERLGEKLVGLEVPSARGGKGFQILVPVRYSLKDA